jgi:hypothetical protein
MAANLIQTITDKINEVQQFLEENPGDGDEPNQTLRNGLLSDLDKFMLRWKQPMTRFDNYQLLRGKIAQISPNQLPLPENQRWFYIGHSSPDLISYYLWNKEVTNQRYTTARANHNIVKSHIYYTHLTRLDNEGDRNENALIREFHGRPRCLNGDNYGKREAGIVYVLEYTSPPNNQ